MHKALFCLLSVSLGFAATAAAAVDFNMLSCCPGENTATEARLVWHSSSDYCVLYCAKASDPADSYTIVPYGRTHKPVVFRSPDADYYRFEARIADLAPRHGHAHGRPERLVRGCDVADRVERLGLRHLVVEHCGDVALRGERASDHIVLLRGFRDELVRYDIDNLTDNMVYSPRCFRVGVFHTRVVYTVPARKATLNRIFQVMNGMIVGGSI